MLISSENTSFSFLRGSPDFLMKLINSINSAVLLLDQDMRLRGFNDVMRALFSNKPDGELLFQKCGNAIGCAHAVDSLAECGDTAKCTGCPIRKAGIMTYSSGIEYQKNKISREFYNSNGEKELKHLQFSTRVINFNSDRYIMLIIDDISETVEQQELIYKQNELLDQLRAEA